ncbi:MAG: IS1380 family transposase [Duodenibacillus sp.]|nr:IS1380 family transposase [Duodenibacillus sp.]
MAATLKALRYDIAFTNRKITPWGGLSLMQKFLEWCRFEEELNSWDLPKPGSNRGYPPAQLILQALVSLWSGSAKFSHMDRIRLDPAVCEMFGWKRPAEHKAFLRLCSRFDQKSSTNFMRRAYRWVFKGAALQGLTLDVDSSALTRWGRQIEGGKVGYNPRNRGRRSHHPLIALIAGVRLVANMWLRPGDSNTANNITGFIEETLENVWPGKVGLFRADSGFWCSEVMNLLESKGIHYIISTRLTHAVQREMVRSCRRWVTVDSGIQASEFLYRASGWARPRRVVAIRQRETEDRRDVPGKTLSLFPDDPYLARWRYTLMTTSMCMGPEDVWRLYRGRADCENRIKELKEDFGLGSLVTRSFWATESALTTVALAYNLISLFRQAVLSAPSFPRLPTLQNRLFAEGALWEERESEFPKLRVGISKGRR